MLNVKAALPYYHAAIEQGHDTATARAIAYRATVAIERDVARWKFHGPTPWAVETWADADSIGFAVESPRIIDARGHLIALVSNDAPMEEANGNAARIVACVNACDAIGDPAAWIEAMRQR